MADESTEFAAVLMQHNRGAAHAEASKALAEVVAACKATGKKGSVTVRLDIEAQPKMGGVIKVTDTITRKVPAADRIASLWYPGDHGDLHRNDPKQHELFGEAEVVRYDEPRHEPPVRPVKAAGTEVRTGIVRGHEVRVETRPMREELFSDGDK